MWTLEPSGKVPKINNPVLIEGLPGIGNVGKIAVDFLVDELKAKKIYSLTSHTMPHSVFVNENNLVELPVIEIYHAKIKKQDFLFLTGDVQPIEEVPSYEFCETVLDLMQKNKGKEIITTGGIGLQHVPDRPIIYCTGTSKELIKKCMQKAKANNQIYGVVGPVVGVSGLLLGLAEKRKIHAAALLAETFGHPMYIGILGARELVKAIDKVYDLKIKMQNLDREIHQMEKEMKKAEEMGRVAKDSAMKKLQKYDMEYIG